jgi:hypothetical protein
MNARRLNLTALLIATTLIAGCSTVPNRELRELEASLHLTLEPTLHSVAIGRKTDVAFVLTNSSSKTIESCVGESRGIQVIDSAGHAAGLVSIQDHESCRVPFVLGPGEKLTVPEQIEIPSRLLPGEGRVLAWVHVLSFSNCDRYGCYAASLSTGLETAILNPSESN